MKRGAVIKAAALLLIAALCAAALCGCGSLRDDRPTQAPAATSDLVPEISPMLTPDMNDGIVKDEDGMIEDNEPIGTAVPSASPKPSASPAVTAKP